MPTIKLGEGTLKLNEINNEINNEITEFTIEIPIVTTYKHKLVTAADLQEMAEWYGWDD